MRPILNKFVMDKFVEDCKKAGMIVIDRKTIEEDSRNHRISCEEFISKIKALQDTACNMQGENNGT